MLFDGWICFSTRQRSRFNIIFEELAEERIESLLKSIKTNILFLKQAYIH